jgi:hypothetical protein
MARLLETVPRFRVQRASVSIDLRLASVLNDRCGVFIICLQSDFFLHRRLKMKPLSS